MKSTTAHTARRNSRQLLPALAAVGGVCGLVSGTATALELGEIQLRSTLGQSLKASIAYALNPNEQLANYCIHLRPATASGGIPSLTRARITVADGVITLIGNTPIREPMLSMQVSVKCPYTAHLARNYTLMFNPAVPAEPAVTAIDATRQAPTATTAGWSPAPALATPTPAGQRFRGEEVPVAANGRYHVQPGDSLTGIVARIADRPAGLWPAANAIFDANPDAFINGDKNLLKAGSWLTIPNLYESAGQPVIVAPPASSDYAPDSRTIDQSTGSAYSGYVPADAQEFDSGFVEPQETASDTQTESTPVAAEAPDSPAEVLSGSSALNEMRPGDVFVTDDSTPVSQAASDAAVDGTRAAAADRTVSSVPVVAVARTTGDTGAWSWLMWLAGSGVALIIGLFLFGRRFRDGFASSPVGASADPAQDPHVEDTPQRNNLASDVDFQFNEPSLSDQSISLDADLGEGTGLQDGTDIDVAQDFGFSATSDLNNAVDLELPEGFDDEAGKPTTDIIPPHLVEESSILESEVPPAEVSAEYDLSMIVDATKQALGEMDTTAKDLMAVQVSAEDEDKQSGSYSLSQDVDYKILEQDYEDEFTQTQALNDEIAKAALELARKMDDDSKLEDTSEQPTGSYDELTAEMPAAQNSDLTAELTANLPNVGDAENEEFISDLDDTGVNEELTADLPAPHDEATIEMEVEGGRVDTKRSKVS